MRIAVIQGSSQREKNPLLEQCVRRAVAGHGHEVVNFGVFPEETAEVSYVQTALCVSLLLASKAVDFVVTGCSSGQGMMLACNCLPGVLCGYLETPADAYLFGRINGGNAASVPLGLNFGWAGESNLQAVLERLFSGPFGVGYPPDQAARKQHDAALVHQLNAVSKLCLGELLSRLPAEVTEGALAREKVTAYVLEQGRDGQVKEFLRRWREGKRKKGDSQTAQNMAQ